MPWLYECKSFCSRLRPGELRLLLKSHFLCCFSHRPAVYNQHQRVAEVVGASVEGFGPERDHSAGLLKHTALEIQMEAGLQHRLYWRSLWNYTSGFNFSRARSTVPSCIRDFPWQTFKELLWEHAIRRCQSKIRAPWHAGGSGVMLLPVKFESPLTDAETALMRSKALRTLIIFWRVSAAVDLLLEDESLTEERERSLRDSLHWLAAGTIWKGKVQCANKTFWSVDWSPLGELMCLLHEISFRRITSQMKSSSDHECLIHCFFGNRSYLLPEIKPALVLNRDFQ